MNVVAPVDRSIQSPSPALAGVQAPAVSPAHSPLKSFDQPILTGRPIPHHVREEPIVLTPSAAAREATVEDNLSKTMDKKHGSSTAVRPRHPRVDSATSLSKDSNSVPSNRHANPSDHPGAPDRDQPTDFGLILAPPVVLGVASE